MKSRIEFVATASDLHGLMSAIEKERPLKYTLTGFPDEPVLHQASTFASIDGFGVSQYGSITLDNSFLLSSPELEIKIKAVPQDKGGTRYFISTPFNPQTLRLKPGGIFEGSTLIAGELLKYSDEPEVKDMFKLFQRELKRQFKRNLSHGYWLGTEAAAMHAAGTRITDDVNSPFSLPREKSA